MVAVETVAKNRAPILLSVRRVAYSMLAGMMATIWPPDSAAFACACASALMLIRQYGHQWPR